MELAHAFILAQCGRYRFMFYLKHIYKILCVRLMSVATEAGSVRELPRPMSLQYSLHVSA